VSYPTETYRSVLSRWRSGDHVGEAKPTMRAYCRTVKLVRQFRRVSASNQHSIMPGLPKGVGSNRIWQGKWVPKTAWVPLPNVLSFRGEQDFDANGVQTAEIVIDNVGVIEHESVGVAGIYHTLERGYYSPWRGYDPQGKRPAVGEQNEWYDILSDKSTEIIVLGGYGDAVVPLFQGLINDVDLTSRPDRITLTCRDGGQTLTDQHVFLNAKARHVPDPITFADRKAADRTEKVGQAAEASNQAGGHSPRFVLDNRNSTEWKSRDYDTPDPSNPPWIQIGLPNGRYDSFVMKPRYEGVTCYVAIKARDRNAPGDGGARKWIYNNHYSDGEWIDEGNGNIPGTNIPWVKKIKRLKAKEATYDLPDYGYVLGDDSKLRLYFTDLDRGKASESRGRAYRAGVIYLRGVKRKMRHEAKRNDWILVDDLSDVVKTVFQWAGLNDWEVETTGVRLRDNAVFNRGNFLIDIINAAAEQVGYVFYMKPPETFNESEAALESLADDASMGIAVFRQNQAMRRQSETLDPVEVVEESTVLQGIQARLTDEPLAYNIRVRGKEAKPKRGGRPLGGDRTYRYMYVYRPPWSRGQRGSFSYYENRDPHREQSPASEDNFRNANIKKYVVHHDEKLRSVDECKIAALFIAFREALEAAQATLEIPALPTVHLDHQIAVYDTGTGLSTRIWVGVRQIEFQAGPQAHFKMGLGGSLIDLPDIQIIRRELVRALRNENFNPGLSTWQLEEPRRHTYRN
jgi:hypothetical protein